MYVYLPRGTRILQTEREKERGREGGIPQGLVIPFKNDGTASSLRCPYLLFSMPVTLSFGPAPIYSIDKSNPCPTTHLNFFYVKEPGSW